MKKKTIAATVSTIPAELVTTVKEAHADVERAFGTALEAAYRCGTRLIEAKDYRPHGSRENWYTETFGISPRVAQNYQRIAKVKFETFKDKGVKTLTEALQLCRTRKAKATGATEGQPTPTEQPAAKGSGTEAQPSPTPSPKPEVTPSPDIIAQLLAFDPKTLPVEQRTFFRHALNRLLAELDRMEQTAGTETKSESQFGIAA